MSSITSEYIIKDKAEVKDDAKAIIERNAATLFLTELFRGKER